MNNLFARVQYTDMYGGTTHSPFLRLINSKHMVKQVKILEIKDKLPVIHAMKEITHMKTESVVNIVNKISDAGSVLLLNDSYITVTQWEQIANECGDNLKWQYLK